MVQQPSPRRVATILWAALLAGATMFMAVALYLVFGLRGGVGQAAPLDAEPILVAVSMGLSAVTVAVSWLWAVRMGVARPIAVRMPVAAPLASGPESAGITRLIIACALCEGGALFAAVVFLLTGNTLALATYAVSWLALAAHHPGERHWARLTGQPAGAPQNRMMRG